MDVVTVVVVVVTVLVLSLVGCGKPPVTAVALAGLLWECLDAEPPTSLFVDGARALFADTAVVTAAP